VLGPPATKILTKSNKTITEIEQFKKICKNIFFFPEKNNLFVFPENICSKLSSYLVVFDRIDPNRWDQLDLRKKNW